MAPETCGAAAEVPLNDLVSDSSPPGAVAAALKALEIKGHHITGTTPTRSDDVDLWSFVRSPSTTLSKAIISSKKRSHHKPIRWG